MEFLGELLAILDTQMDTPESYGWFHILFFALSLLAAYILCVFYKRGKIRNVPSVVLWVAVVVTLLEIYKQINYTFQYENGTITADFQWYAFPFQFCSTPMYIGLLAGLTKKGKRHTAASAYLATYALFAGLCVMFYPDTVFIGTIGINIQTMICHGSMVTIGIFLLYTNYVPVNHRLILKAFPVFSTCLIIAIILNEVAFRTGLLLTDTFNMFFVSPYCEPSLPVYSFIQNVLPFPVCLLLYLLGFTLASYLLSLIAMGIHRFSKQKVNIN